MKMETEIGILDRYYNSFINLENDYDFYIGLVDYLKYVNSVPEFDYAASLLPKIRISEEKKLENLEKKAVTALVKMNAEISTLVKNNKIDNTTIEKELVDFGYWIDGLMVGSGSLTSSLSSILVRVIYKLDELGFRNEISKYVTFFKNSTNIEKFILPLGYSLFEKEKRIFDMRSETEIWGEFNRLALAYLVITNGEEYHRKLIEEAGPDGKRNLAKWWEAANFVFVLGDPTESRTPLTGMKSRCPNR
jgi:hypothetical protein